MGMPAIGSRWKAFFGLALEIAKDRGGAVVEIRSHRECNSGSMYVCLKWPNGEIVPWGSLSSFLDKFVPFEEQTIEKRLARSPYSVGPDGETAGYLAGCTGNRWL